MRLFLSLLLILASGAAQAAVTCTEKPKSEWLPAEQVKSRAMASGYQISVFKTTKGNCYEIYGKNRDGRLVEIYYDPTNGNVVQESTR